MAWSAFLIFIGAGAVGMAIHNETVAAERRRNPSGSSTAPGEEMPLYEPCKDRKDQRDI